MINANDLKLVGDMIKGQIPGKGFALVVFDTSDDLREFRYISNCERADMIATFEALITKWKKHNDKNN
jgi:hypothetical protein